MNQTSTPNRENQSRSKRLAPWAWFGLLSAALFVVIGLGLFLLNKDARSWTLVHIALVSALALATLGLAAVWFFKWVCCWRNFRRFLFGVACFITLLALVLAEENLRGKHAWQKHRRELEAAGEKLDLAALVPAEVPDEKNLAVMPLLKPLLDFTQTNGTIVWGDTNGNARLDGLSATIPTHRDTNDNLVFGSVENGTFADLHQWREFYRGNTNYPQAAETASPAETVMTALGKFDREISQLREAVSSRPYSRFPIQYGYEPSWEILLPHLSRLKALTVLMNVRATAELDAGRGSDALEDMRIALRVSDSIRDEPILIDHLVRVAMIAINLTAIREGLVRHTWTDAQLSELQKHLGSIDLLAEYKLAMRGERALCIGGLDYVRRKGFAANPMYYVSNDDTGASSTGSFGGMPSGWFYQNMLAISQYAEEYILPAVDERAHRVYPNITEKGAHAVLDMSKGPYTIFARMFLPALERAVCKSARMQTYVDATRVGCAIERYRLANGKLPETLDALAPYFITNVPVDVIDGKPLKYRAEKDSYILYSIGWNQADDSGQIVWLKNKKESGPDVAKGDWVWSMALK